MRERWMDKREMDKWTREKWMDGQNIYISTHMDIRNVGINTLDETPLYIWLWWSNGLSPCQLKCVGAMLGYVYVCVRI